MNPSILQFIANTCLDAGVFLWVAFIAYLVQQALNKRRMPSSCEESEQE